MSNEMTDARAAEVLDRIAAALPDVGVNGWYVGVEAAKYAAARLRGEAAQGEVVVTRDEDGEIILVSRQDSDGRVLSVIAQTTHAGGKAQGEQQAVAINGARVHRFAKENGIDFTKLMQLINGCIIARPQPAVAGDAVRSTLLKLAVHVRPTCSELYNEAIDALAAAPAAPESGSKQRVAAAHARIRGLIAGFDDAAPAPVAGDAVAGLISLWREPLEDNGEQFTEFDEGCQQTYRECADAMEQALAQDRAAQGGPLAELAGYTIVPTSNLRRIAEELGMEGGIYAPKLRREVLAYIEVSPSLLAEAGRASQGAAAGVPKWPNGCDRTVPAALRYLAANPRPSGGEDKYNWAHLLQLAGEIEVMAARLKNAAPSAPTQGADREVRDEDGNAIDSRNAGEDYA